MWLWRLTWNLGQRIGYVLNAMCILNNNFVMDSLKISFRLLRWIGNGNSYKSRLILGNYFQLFSITWNYNSAYYADTNGWRTVGNLLIRDTIQHFHIHFFFFSSFSNCYWFESRFYVGLGMNGTPQYYGIGLELYWSTLLGCWPVGGRKGIFGSIERRQILICWVN